MPLAHPFLKWAGGKTQLIETFRRFYPPELRARKIDVYVEPFLGSGAVFFDVAQHYKIKSALLGDINEELILAWRVIQTDVEKLMGVLERYVKKYWRLGRQEQRAFYYEIRSDYNRQRSRIDYNRYSEKWIRRAAQLIFLNKTCFNGLFRMNSKGEFNTPVGDYKRPKFFKPENLQRIARLLQMAEVRKLHFGEVTDLVSGTAFVYFDPPYRPLSRSSSFTSYSTFQFADQQQRELAAVFATLDGKGCKLMLSNSDPKNENPDDDFFDELYREYHVFRVKASRMINSKKDGRGQINEILVTNYAVRNAAVKQESAEIR